MSTVGARIEPGCADQSDLHAKLRERHAKLRHRHAKNVVPSVKHGLSPRSHDMRYAADVEP